MTLNIEYPPAPQSSPEGKSTEREGCGSDGFGSLNGRKQKQSQWQVNASAD